MGRSPEATPNTSRVGNLREEGLFGVACSYVALFSVAFRNMICTNVLKLCRYPILTGFLSVIYIELWDLARERWIPILRS